MKFQASTLFIFKKIHIRKIYTSTGNRSIFIFSSLHEINCNAKSTIFKSNKKNVFNRNSLIKCANLKLNKLAQNSDI